MVCFAFENKISERAAEIVTKLLRHNRIFDFRFYLEISGCAE